MILLSHPRCGSEWFLSSLPNHKHIYWELFSLNELMTYYKELHPDVTPGSVPFVSKIALMKYGLKQSYAFKIHFTDLHREMQKPTWPQLLEVIQKHNVYLMTRQNKRETMISFIIANYDDRNFHKTNNIYKPIPKLTREQVAKHYNFVYGQVDNLKSLFTYKEELLYEDLLKGNAPKTILWDPSISPIKQRNSIDKIQLIENYEEVLTWIDELIQDSQVQSQP